MADIIDMPPSADIFQSKADILVNPVNTKGRSGKGLAKKFAEWAPEKQELFKEWCLEALPEGGDGFFVSEPLHTGLPAVIFLCTKEHPANPSKIEWIKKGIDLLAADLRTPCWGYPLTIAIPALGCGLGGLDWADVRPIIVAALKDIDTLTVELYPPYVSA